MSYLIADLHCDLLCYLAHDEKRTPYDLAVRCAIPQLRDGNVKFQVLAIYTTTCESSVDEGIQQVKQYQKLLSDYTSVFTNDYNNNQDKIVIVPSIENASSVFGETEELELGFQRIISIEQSLSKIAYLSMTWNEENRFGGGAHTEIGIKEDGIRLLHFLNDRQIPIDLSHTSDALAYSIIEEINKKSLSLPVIASHSNSRSVTNAARNLPDELIKEIIRRKGIIGLNFVKDFMGVDLYHHVDHFLNLGAENTLCFGADFFYGMDVPPHHRKPPENLFSKKYGNAGVYPTILKEWKEVLHLNNDIIKNISWINLNRFMEEEVYGSLRATSSRCT